MVFHIDPTELPELPELPGPNGQDYIRAARLSLLEEQERAAIDEVRLKFDQENHNKHGHKHPHGAWHKHKRDHRHSIHGESSYPEPFRKRGSKSNIYLVHENYSPPPYASPQEGFPHGPPPPESLPQSLPPPGFKFEDKHGDKHGHKFGKRKPPPFIKDPNAPNDKGNFVLIIIGLFGLVHMLPFIFFFTANEYWMYKFRNTTSNSTDANDRTYLQTNFASLTKLTVTAPGVVCNFVAAIGGHKIKAQTRVFCVLFFHSMILVASAIFANINTDDWQVTFFIITQVLQLIMACAMSLGGSGSMGLISKLPPRYMKAQLMGEGGAGVFSAILRLISIFCTPSTVGAALMYFITGSVLMVLTSIVFYFATQTEFFKYYTRSSKEERKEKMRNFGDFKEILKILWPLLLLSTIPMLVPAPSITNLVVSEYYGKDSVWGNKYFITVCTYLVPAFTGLIGRGLFNYMDYDCSIPTLCFLVISREVVFGSLTFLSNAKPRHNLPVLLKHDWEYGLMQAGNQLTSGFVMNLNMIKLMRMVPKDRIELSMMVNMFFMSIMSAATSPLGVIIVNLL